MGSGVPLKTIRAVIYWIYLPNVSLTEDLFQPVEIQDIRPRYRANLLV
jgi:hypothetical protein